MAEKRCIKLIVFIDIHESGDVVVEASSEYAVLAPAYMKAIKEAVRNVTRPLLSLLWKERHG